MPDTLPVAAVSGVIGAGLGALGVTLEGRRNRRANRDAERRQVGRQLLQLVIDLFESTNLAQSQHAGLEHARTSGSAEYFEATLAIHTQWSTAWESARRQGEALADQVDDEATRNASIEFIKAADRSRRDPRDSTWERELGEAFVRAKEMLGPLTRR